jgi:hypothetical protein
LRKFKKFPFYFLQQWRDACNQVVQQHLPTTAMVSDQFSAQPWEHGMPDYASNSSQIYCLKLNRALIIYRCRVFREHLKGNPKKAANPTESPQTQTQKEY